MYIVTKEPPAEKPRKEQEVRLRQPPPRTVIVAPVGAKSEAVEQNYVSAKIWSTAPVKVWNVTEDGHEALVTDRDGKPIIISSDNPNVRLGTAPFKRRFEAISEVAHVTVELERW
jgi:hypothetical protein